MSAILAPCRLCLGGEFSRRRYNREVKDILIVQRDVVGVFRHKHLGPIRRLPVIRLTVLSRGGKTLYK